jgi:hypothetical protein
VTRRELISELIRGLDTVDLADAEKLRTREQLEALGIPTCRKRSRRSDGNAFGTRLRRSSLRAAESSSASLARPYGKRSGFNDYLT